jgi:hypothetical protein
VPISLLVSLELVKFAQGQFMGFDLAMTHFVPGSARAALLASKPKLKDATTPDHKADQEKKQGQSVSVKIGAFSSS